ncbi:MAG: hypothetical protein Q9169_001028 [Polycauliona sp. 2 TL-2023]
MATIPSRRIVVFSGGSAANSLVDVFNGLIEKNNCTLSYIIPISDNGGSSSELIRVFGGPGIGDIRSRLVRLIPPTNAPILHFFNHRLPPSSIDASAEFLTLLDLTSPLYHPIPSPQALLIRSILSHLHLEILKRIRPPSSTFNFQSASIGNLFLTGARLLTGSFESAIYLLAIIGGVDESRTAVLPAIVSNFTHHISAGLTDGTIITGQNAISHPSAPTALSESTDIAIHCGTAYVSSATSTGPSHHAGVSNAYPIEDATLPGSLPTLRASQLQFSKSADQPLPAPISRIWYINPYGQEMHPSPNPKAIAAVQASDAVIYSIGSLYTSLAPSLILQGIGSAIANGPRFKILILNGSLDRETGGFEGLDFVKAIVRCCGASSSSSSSSSLPRVISNRGTAASTPVVDGDDTTTDSTPDRDDNDIMKQRVRQYITHLIYIDHPSAPYVDREKLSAWGMEGVRLYGRKGEDGKMRYDEKALTQALGMILGKRDGKERSRRNTMEGG